MPIEVEAFYSMLGIAKRAGVLTLGTDAVLAAVAAGKAGLVLLDSGAFYGAALRETPADRLGFAVGKPGRMCAAVAKGTLCDKLASLAG